MIGKTISHYTIIEKLGEGGMGVVYKAHDTALDRSVALKFLPNYLTTDPVEKERFYHEARAAAALTHNNIAVVYEIGEQDGQVFIVMECVEGKTLRQIISGNTLSIKQVLDMAIQIADGLNAAHKKGIVHRDIKPENIMLATDGGVVKIMDFGLAKLKGATKLTKAGSTLGTAAYMSPEQAQGEEVDQRSDIFSFGVVLYEMLTSKLPFRGEHHAALLYSIVNEQPPPIARFNEKVTQELAHIVGKALAKDTDERYQHADDMLADLRSERKKLEYAKAAYTTTTVATQPEEQQPRSQVTKPSKIFVWSGIFGSILLIAAIVFFVFLQTRTLRLNPNMTITNLPITFADIGYPGFSKDGNWVAFPAVNTDGKWGVYFMNPRNGEPRLLTIADGILANPLDISPDMSQVLCDITLPGKQNGIYAIPTSGGTPQLLAEKGTSGRWRPDGQRIGYIVRGRNRQFWTMKSDGSDARREFADSLDDAITISFAWSPDGKSIAWNRSFPEGCTEIIIRELVSGVEHQITFDKSVIDEITWASNNQIFFTSDKSGNTNIWMISASGGETIQVTRGALNDAGVKISIDGNRLLYHEQSATCRIWLADMQGKRQLLFSPDSRELQVPSLSPDGQQVMFRSSRRPIRNSRQIFVAQRDGSRLAQVTPSEEWHANAHWSPDGKQIVYSSWAGWKNLKSARIYIAEVGNFRSPILLGEGVEGWWLDNDRIDLLLVQPMWKSKIYSLNQHKILETSQDSTLQFPLADGRYNLVFDSRPGTLGWWVVEKRHESASKGRVQIVTGWGPAFPSPSLHYLLYRDADGKNWKISLPDGKRERLPEFLDNLSPWNADYTLSWDDKQIIYVEQQQDVKLVLAENVFE